LDQSNPRGGATAFACCACAFRAESACRKSCSRDEFANFCMDKLHESTGSAAGAGGSAPAAGRGGCGAFWTTMAAAEKAG
jgi:hypothetical protein